MGEQADMLLLPHFILNHSSYTSWELNHTYISHEKEIFICTSVFSGFAVTFHTHHLFAGISWSCQRSARRICNDTDTSKPYHWHMGIAKTMKELILVMSLVSCGTDEILPIPQYDRLVCFYIVADNGLSLQADRFLSDITTYCKNGNVNNKEKLVIYINDKTGCYMYESSTNGLMKVWNSHNVNSTDKNIIRQVLASMSCKYPSKETGLILWSHGLGWLPKGNDTRSFGDDQGFSVDIYELAESFPLKYDYIIFDACFMGSLEVFAEMYECCNYMVSSPCIVPAEGIIDTISISSILQESDIRTRLTQVCKHYADVYSQKDTSVTLVNMGEFENVLNACKNISVNTEIMHNKGLLKYEFRNNDVFYDFGSLAQEKSFLANFIIDAEKTGNYDSYCGISIYIPQDCNKDYISPYTNTRWNRLTAWIEKFIHKDP